MTIHFALVAPTVHRKARRAVNFVMLEPHHLEGFELRHLVGVAEVRHQLHADPRDWQVVQHAAQTSPDAIWRRSNETWAIEFDAGAYTRCALLEKAQAFRAGFDGQIWAVNSNTRRATIAHLLHNLPLLVRPY